MIVHLPLSIATQLRVKDGFDYKLVVAGFFLRMSHTELISILGDKAQRLNALSIVEMADQLGLDLTNDSVVVGDINLREFHGGT